MKLKHSNDLIVLNEVEILDKGKQRFVKFESG